MDKKILADLNNAIIELKCALAVPAESDLIKAGCIQYFEFSFERAWKAIKSISADQGLDCQSPKNCLKQAYRLGWISDETIWLKMLNARNLISHTYNSQLALTVNPPGLSETNFLERISL